MKYLNSSTVNVMPILLVLLLNGCGEDRTKIDKLKISPATESMTPKKTSASQESSSTPESTSGSQESSSTPESTSGSQESSSTPESTSASQEGGSTP